MMNQLGINSRFLFLQVFNCLIPLIWLGLSITALLGLKKKSLGETARVLWAIFICVVPILGAVAFWVVSPSEKADDGGVG